MNRSSARIFVAAISVGGVAAGLVSLELDGDTIILLTAMISAPLAVSALQGNSAEYLQVLAILSTAALTSWLTSPPGIACTPLANGMIVFPASVAVGGVVQFIQRRLAPDLLDQ